MILQEYFFKDALDKLVFFIVISIKKKKVFLATWWECSSSEEGEASLCCLSSAPSLQWHQEPSQVRQVEPCRGAGAGMEAVRSSGPPPPKCEGRLRVGIGEEVLVHTDSLGYHKELSGSGTSSAGCVVSFWTELLLCSPCIWHPVPKACPAFLSL